jgi:long-chain fatty acid transport protein
MKTLAMSVSALALSASMSMGAGLDRSGQSVSSIYSADGTVGLSYATINPSVTGVGTIAATEYDVGKSYTMTTFTYTNEISDGLTLGLIVDQPYGASVLYNGDPAASSLGGTGAELESQALSIIGKYDVNEAVSVHAGLRRQSVEAEVSLGGLSYNNPLAIGGDYDATIDKSSSSGWLIGAAYEIPDIALRVSATYFSEVEHSADTTETIAGGVANAPGTVDFVTPSAFNLDFQTGIAADTLLTASYRRSNYSDLDVVPTLLGSDLVNLNDAQRFTLGVGRRFSDDLSGSVTLSYEPEGDELVSPLGPTNGLMGISIGARYTVGEAIISGGVNYSKLGDAQADVGGNRADFTGNSSLSFGLKVEVGF